MAMTVLERFKGWGPRTGKPRAELARILGISQPYAMEIARGAPIGSTERLAQVAATFDLSGDDVLESLREWYPHHFAPGVDASSELDNEATHNQQASGECGGAL